MAWILLVVNHRLGVEEIQAVVDIAHGNRIPVGLSPSVDIGRELIDIGALQRQAQSQKRKSGNDKGPMIEMVVGDTFHREAIQARGPHVLYNRHRP